MEISIVDNKLQYEWDSEWSTWVVFQEDEDVKKIFAQAKTLCDSLGKGKSKGKNGR